MSFLSVSGCWNTVKEGRRNAASRKRKVLRLERLEDRTVPTTLTVVNTLDSGAGSLRAAIGSAKSGDAVVFDSKLDGQTITLTSGELDVAKNLSISIAGPGAGKLSISGGSHSRIFDVASGARVTLSDLTITQGKAAVGGAIDNAGALTISSSVLSNNQSVGGAGGGAIVNEAGATLKLTGSTLVGNTATAKVGADVFGGGLLNYGTAFIITSTFKSNQAVGGGSSDFFGSSRAGGIDNFGGAYLAVTDSSFLYNQVKGTSSSGGSGGAIENNAGFDEKTPSTAIINQCQFTGNLATTGLANGGAVDNEGTGATVTISNSSFKSNQSIGTGSSEGLGGAIMNIEGAQMTVLGSTLTGNQAMGSHHATNLAANPPTGSGQGGGIVNGGATLTLIDTTLTGNQAIGGNTDSGPGGLAEGGGIANWGVSLVGTPGVVTLIGCTLTGNEAIAGQGGPGTSLYPAGFAVGGGIDDSFSGVMHVFGSTIQNNQALGGNGGSGQPGGAALGGGVSVGFSTLLGMKDNSTLQMTSSFLAGNLAQGGAGGKGAAGGVASGGGLSVTVGSSADVIASTIQQNTVTGGKAGAKGVAGHGVGGGVSNLGDFTADVLTAITKNHASTSNDNLFGVVAPAREEIQVFDRRFNECSPGGGLAPPDCCCRPASAARRERQNDGIG